MATETDKLKVGEIVIKDAEPDDRANGNFLDKHLDSRVIVDSEDERQQNESLLRLDGPERQIQIWKAQIRVLRGHDRRTRYEMGKRLAAIQAERAKAKVGTFTTVDLKELKIGIPAAYRLINFYQRIEFKLDAYLLQFAKAQEKFPIEDAEDYEKRNADAKVDALNQVMADEDARISELRKTKSAQPTDYRLVIECGTHRQRERLKAKWLSLEDKLRSSLVRTAVMNAKNPS